MYIQRAMQLACLSLLIVLFAACTGRQTPEAVLPTEPTPSANEWPTQDWRTAAPEDQGVDPAGIARAVERSQLMNLHSMLVIRHGYILSENYYAGNDANKRHELYSVTKSFTSTLIGIAVDQEIIADIDQPVLDSFPTLEVENSTPDKASMTLKHLLTMTSGLDWYEGDPVYRAMYMSQDWVGYVMGISMREAPGTEFNYCSGCSHVLSAALQQAAGVNTSDYAEANLFKPLGITNYAWDADAHGIPIGGWGLQLTPRDMAKLGYLYLHRGSWAGQQIVPETWIEASTQTQIGTGGEWDYGYQWWIDNEHGAYAARGRYGQLIYVLPELDLIVVSTAAAESDEPVIALIEEEIIPAITSE